MNPSRIVITGTIASGKSTLSELLKSLGYKVLSADDVNRDLIKKGGINYLAIKNSGCFDDAFEDDNLDKNKLSRIIFSDKDKLNKLNGLTHKNIINEIENRINKIEDKVVFIEIPLFFQTKEKISYDEVWLVRADYSTQLERLMQRDDIDISYAKQKIETQEELMEMEKQSDVVFDNSSTVEDLMKKLKIVLEKKDLLWKY